MKYGNGNFQSYISAPKKNRSTIILGLYRFGKFCQFSNDTTLQDTKPMLNLTGCEYWKWKVPYGYNSTPKKNTPSKILAFLDLASLQIIKRYNASRSMINLTGEVWKIENSKRYISTQKKNTSTIILGLYRFGNFCQFANDTTLQNIRPMLNLTGWELRMENFVTVQLNAKKELS